MKIVAVTGALPATTGVVFGFADGKASAPVTLKVIEFNATAGAAAARRHRAEKKFFTVSSRRA
jgi:hypothetical protein